MWKIVVSNSNSMSQSLYIEGSSMDNVSLRETRIITGTTLTTERKKILLESILKGWDKESPKRCLLNIV